MTTNQISIYALCHPITGEARYVGQTSNIKKRMQHHGYDAKGNPNKSLYLYNWWNKCLREHNIFPTVQIISTGLSRDRANKFEYHIIKNAREQGCRLVNIKDGGFAGSPSIETRAKISATQKGRTLSSEHRAKLSAARMGRVMPPEIRARISATQKGKKGRVCSPETRAKMSTAHKGCSHSPERRAKLSLAAHKYHKEHPNARINQKTLYQA